MCYRNLGLLAAYQGDVDAAHRHYQQGLSLARTIGDREGEALSLARRSLLHHQQGKHERAHAEAAQAVALARDLRNTQVLGQALTHLGHAQLALAQLQEAVASYAEAWQLHPGTEPALEPLAGLAQAALHQGDLEGALEFVNELLAHLETNPLFGRALDPFRIYLTCYEVLLAAGDGRRQALLARAHRLLQDQAGRLPHGMPRRRFLQRVPSHLALYRTYRAAAATGDGAAPE
jgi:ATP/maltotriose-dependent transcriptional regulator MalT